MLKKLVKIISLLALLLVLALPSLAQNTKGDAPQSKRESRFRKSDKKTKIFGNRKNKSKKNTDRVGRSTRSWRVRSRPSGESARQSLPKSGHTPERSPTGKPTIHRRTASGGAIRITTKPKKNNNLYPQHGRFVNNPSKTPRTTERGVSNRSALAKVSRLQSSQPRPVRNRRIKARSASRSYSPHKTINIQARFPRPKRKVEKAYTKDISGRRIRTRNFESKRPIIIESQSAKRFSRTAKDKAIKHPNQEFGRFRNFSSVQSTNKGIRKPRVKPRSASGRASTTFVNKQFMPNPFVQPRATERASSDRWTRRTLKKLQGPEPRPGKKRKITPRSGSRSYVSGKTINVWARFPRPKKKGERGVTTDIAGKQLRTKNYHSPKQEIIEPQYQPYYRRKKVGDRVYRGPAAGTSSSATRGPRAWIGDIARRAIRGIKKPKTPVPGIQSGGYRTATRHGETRISKEPLPVKQPGIGAEILRYASGKVKGRRSAKGGGSISGRVWNNSGNSLAGRGPGSSAAGNFSGSIKAKRPEKGGGSISGSWNNRNRPIATKVPPPSGLRVNGFPGKMRRFEDGQPGFRDQGEEFTGFIRAGKPLKGGGSRSGKSWNNKNTPVPIKGPGIGIYGVAYKGFNKAKRPAQGGGSVSGKLWNNNRAAIAVRTPGKGADGLRGFSGNLKASRPTKGGGSVSGKLWNNNETALNAKVPGKEAFSMRGFSGNIKAKRPAKGGGSISGKLWNNNETALNAKVPDKEAFSMRGFSGNIKAKRPAKGGGSISGKLWNNKETPLDTRIPGKEAFNMRGYSGNIKAQKPLKGGGSVSGKLWNNKESPIVVRTPGAQGMSANGYTGTIKLSRFKRDYVKNPNSSALATRKARPDKSTFLEGDLQVRVKKHDYVKNKSVDKDAAKAREPGRSFGKAADFQGNIKMQKFQLFSRTEQHPDTKFIRTNKNNVDEERDMLTNFKLWWARLFRKEETQPDHLKEKGRKPRYDKGEAGLWYE